MLSLDHDPSTYADWLDEIENSETKEAFRYLVGAAACLRNFQCHAQLKGRKGPLRDFRFIEGSSQPFSFITNQRKGLLFYFRPPAVRSGRYTFEVLRAELGSVSQNPSGEWTARINTVDDARRLWALLGLQ
jgi:hypothetical protein